MTVEHASGEWVAKGWVFDSENPLQPETSRRVVERQSRRLSKGSTTQLKTLIATADIWRLPFYENADADDGAFMTVEVRDGERYRAITRVSVRHAELDDLARTLLQLGEFTIPDALRPRAAS